MERRSPTPGRFGTEVAARLASFTSSHPGLSLSAAANLLVDEGLRLTEHPGIAFRDGPTGRRAALAAGPDVWEVVRAVRSARLAEPELDEDDVLSLVVEDTGVTGPPPPPRSRPRSAQLTARRQLPRPCGDASAICSPASSWQPRFSLMRSEERRIGKECRSRWSPY